MKVFLVEDALPIRERLKSSVEEAGGIVIGSADTEQDAVKGILTTRPDIAVIDLALAEGNGIDVLRRIKVASPAMVVIVLTNYNNILYRKICMENGADFFLDKTIDFPRFEDLIKTFACVAG